MKLLFHYSILLLAILLPATATAHDFEVDGIYYNINGNEATVTKDGSYSNKYSGSVAIPATVTYNGTTYPVTSIGESAFYWCTGMTSIVIPNSVISIGNEAFSWCTGLTSIVIPNSVTSIGNKAFSYCTGLTSIVIPNSVTSIGNEAFSWCTGLTNIVIPNSVTSISESAFEYCSSLTSIDIPNSVTTIGEAAFGGCSGLTSIVIPNSVTAIGDRAFWGCTGLTSVVIPNSVTTIGNGAFFNCIGLTSIVIPNSVTKIGSGTFESCSGLTSVVIPNSVTEIGESAFSMCSGLTSIDIPNSVTTIGSKAFFNCIGLTSIVIPNSVTEIGVLAFAYCTGLTSIDIPNSVTSIGLEAFRGCDGLTSIVIASGNPRYDSRNNCNAIIETASNALIAGCKNTTIPNSVTSIGESAFYGCEGLTGIDIPNSVTVIGSRAFYGCDGLTGIVIPNSVTKIGDDAFYGCDGMTSIVIPNSVTSIGKEAFSGCTGLTDVYCYIADLSRVSIGYKPFDSYGGYSGRTLHVLPGMADAYRADEHWNPYFGKIVEIVSADVNRDNEVNIADVNATIDNILGGSGNPTADVNADGEVNIADVNAIINIILSSAPPQHDHEYVDLGLPSGTLWATCNLGANSPEEYGSYFAWGETTPKGVYTWWTYKWCDDMITKYCINSDDGTVDGKTELDPQDDAAYVNWGAAWRMPSREQCLELCESCTWQQTTRNGVKGLLVTGPNGHTMFIPAAGERYDDGAGNLGTDGHYWSRTLYSKGDSPSYSAFNLSFYLDNLSSNYGYYRYYGFSVRAVRVSQN